MSFSSDFGSVLTDLGGAAQVGFGIYNETQGGPAINTSIGTPNVTPGSVAGATTLFGFSLTEIFVGVLLILGIVVTIHFATK